MAEPGSPKPPEAEKAFADPASEEEEQTPPPAAKEAPAEAAAAPAAAAAPEPEPEPAAPAEPEPNGVLPRAASKEPEPQPSEPAAAAAATGAAALASRSSSASMSRSSSAAAADLPRTSSSGAAAVARTSSAAAAVMSNAARSSSTGGGAAPVPPTAAPAAAAATPPVPPRPLSRGASTGAGLPSPRAQHHEHVAPPADADGGEAPCVSVLREQLSQGGKLALTGGMTQPAPPPPREKDTSMRRLSEHDKINNTNALELLGKGEFKLIPGRDVVPYDRLITLRLEDGVDVTRKEEYLSAEEFKTVLKCEREEFVKMPAWKRLQLKKSTQLF